MTGPAAAFPTFDEFAAAVLEALLLTHDDAVTPATDLYDGLGLDSLQAVELLMLVEQWSGRGDLAGELPVLFTMGDAYAYALALVDPPREPRPAAQAVGSQAGRVDS